MVNLAVVDLVVVVAVVLAAIVDEGSKTEMNKT